MNIVRTVALMVAVASVGIASGQTGQTLYKLIDKNGKITYSESPPKNFDGKVIRMDIDPKTNSATLIKPRAGAEGGATATEAFKADLKKAASKREQARIRATELRAELEAAKKELEEAQANPGEENLTFNRNASTPAKAGDAGQATKPGKSGTSGTPGNTAGAGNSGVKRGARPVYTEAFSEKLTAMEANIAKLEKQLEEAERDSL